MAKTITEYKKIIWEYEKRRKLNYKTIKNLSRRIRSMKACLASREARENKTGKKIDSLIESINDFFSVKIESNCFDAEHKLARNVYYKFGLEKQLKDSLLSSKINRRSKVAAKARRSFTISFKTNLANKEAFYNFKNYFKD